MKTYKIVLTGGPCAGKTTAIEEVKKHLINMGFCVITVSETATEMITGGISPSNVGQIVFQRNLLRMQLIKESVFLQCAESLGKDVVILFDRGVFDGKAYLNDFEFSQILDELNLCENELFDYYDAVLFLDSVASDCDGNYTTSNNTARSETREEAAQINERTYNVWKNHKNLHIINNEETFDYKISKLLGIIDNLFIKAY